MTNNFSIGDVVELNSGGEVMTVEAIDEDGVSCVWFESKKVERAIFNAQTLKKHIRPSVTSVKLTRS